MPLNKIPKLREPKGPVVQEIRDKFLKEVYALEPEAFYQQDIKLIENMDFLLQRCVIMQRKDVEASVKMVTDMLRWRKENKVYDLYDSHFPQEVHVCGAAFAYEKDLFGNNTLYMRACMGRNCPELRPFMKDYMNRLMMEVDDPINGESFALIIDLTKVSWTNYDLEMLHHLLACLKEHFPVNLDYVLAINFPWILSTVWTLIKHLIPNEKRNAVQFINSDQIFEFVAKENCPEFLGGTCSRPIIGSTEASSFTAVDYVISMTDGTITNKRLRELLGQFKDILPESHYLKLKKQIELYKDGQYITPKMFDKISLNGNESNNNDGEIQDLNQTSKTKDNLKISDNNNINNNGINIK